MFATVKGNKGAGVARAEEEGGKSQKMSDIVGLWRLNRF